MTVKLPSGCHPAEVKGKSTGVVDGPVASLYTRSTTTEDITSQTLASLSPGTGELDSIYRYISYFMRILLTI